MRMNELITNNFLNRSIKPFFDFNFNDFVPSLKTDIKEKENEYEIFLDVPGIPKENINISLENGYLNVSTSINEENKEDNEKWIVKERYSSSQSQSIYVGDVEEKDIKANIKDGVLKIVVPNKSKLPSKKTINIE